MKIEFAPVTRFDQVPLAAYAMEIMAAASGSALFDDLPIDKDALLEVIREDPSVFDLETENDYLKEEDHAAKNLAGEKFATQLSGFLESRRETLKASYPFEINPGPNIRLKNAGELCAINLATFLLTLFLALRKTDLVQVAANDVREFDKKFAPVFEIISTYALCAKIGGSTAWWVGNARSHQRFLEHLRKVARVAGSGTVREEEQLEANQIKVNDGGVDAFGLTTHQGNIQPDAECYVLGATLQRDSRKHKIVGPAELNRIRGFFHHGPNVAYTGVLAIPFEGTDAEANNCRDENCVYFPLEAIQTNLGLTSEMCSTPNINCFRRTLDRQMVIKSRPIWNCLTVSVHDKDFAFQLPGKQCV